MGRMGCVSIPLTPNSVTSLCRKDLPLTTPGDQQSQVVFASIIELQMEAREHGRSSNTIDTQDLLNCYHIFVKHSESPPNQQDPRRKETLLHSAAKLKDGAVPSHANTCSTGSNRRAAWRVPRRVGTEIQYMTCPSLRQYSRALRDACCRRDRRVDGHSL